MRAVNVQLIMPQTFKTLALCALSLFACAAAHAATMTYNIDVTVTTSYRSTVLPVSASYTLTFDPTLVYSSDTTAGLTVKSLSFANGPSAFNYYLGQGYTGNLAIGGLLNTVGGGLLAGTDDYNFGITGFLSPHPQLSNFTVVRASLPGGFYSAIYSNDAILTVTQVGVTPEPSSLALLGTGVLGIIGIARRRFA